MDKNRSVSNQCGVDLAVGLGYFLVRTSRKQLRRLKPKRSNYEGKNKLSSNTIIFTIYSFAMLNENFLVFATCLKPHMPTLTLSYRISLKYYRGTAKGTGDVTTPSPHIPSNQYLQQLNLKTWYIIIGNSSSV